MNIYFKWTWPALVVLLLSAIQALAPHSETISFSQPLYASEGETADDSPADSTKRAAAISEGSAEIPWLHVTVETNYGWFYQESIGRAWTTRTRDSEERVDVGLICIKVKAHNEVQQCAPDTSYVEATDFKRRIGTRKKTAIVTAWTKDPDIKETSVSLDP